MVIPVPPPSAIKTGKDGSASITLSFAQGTDPDVAQVQVQNKVALATPRLPLAVQQQGLRIAKATRNFLLVVGFVANLLVGRVHERHHLSADELAART